MTRFGVLVGTLAALALGRDLAAEQQRQARDGFWFGAALGSGWARVSCQICQGNNRSGLSGTLRLGGGVSRKVRSEEHTSELQSPCNLVCRLLLEKKKTEQLRIPHRALASFLPAALRADSHHDSSRLV